MASKILIPGADRSHWYGDDYPGLMMTVPMEKGLLHSTETGSGGVPGYRSGGAAPNVTVCPWGKLGRKVWQHFYLDQSSRALVDSPSTPVRENRDNVWQVEIIGYSDPTLGKPRGLYLMDLPDDDLAWLAGVIKQMQDLTDVPNAWKRPWPIYPATVTRMTSGQYDAWRGMCCHGQAPGNSHGDAALPIDRIEALIDGQTTTPEDDMPTLAEIKTVVRDAVKDVLANVPLVQVYKYPGGKQTKHEVWSITHVLDNDRRIQHDHEVQLGSLSAQIAGVTAQVKALAATSGVDVQEVYDKAYAGAEAAINAKIDDADVTLNPAG